MTEQGGSVIDVSVGFDGGRDEAFLAEAEGCAGEDGGAPAAAGIAVHGLSSAMKQYPEAIKMTPITTGVSTVKDRMIVPAIVIRPPTVLFLMATPSAPTG